MSCITLLHVAVANWFFSALAFAVKAERTAMRPVIINVLKEVSLLCVCSVSLSVIAVVVL